MLELKFRDKEHLEELIEEYNDLCVFNVIYGTNKNIVIFKKKEASEASYLENKILDLKVENEKMTTKIDELSEFVINNMLAIADMYEINRNYYLSLNEASLKEKCNRVPTHIQSVYQKLYKLGLKALNEIPFEVRMNLKA